MAVGCPDCGTVQVLPTLPPRGIAVCPRCRHDLERAAGRSVTAGLACAAATFLLLFPANILPFLSIDFAGVTRESRLGSGVAVLWDQGWIALAALVAVLAVALPFIRFGLLSACLGAVRFGRRPPWLGPAFRWATRLDLWAMQDVFLVACAIGYGRVAAYIPVHIGAGGWCFIAAALLSMISHAVLDRRTVWRAIAAEEEVAPGEKLVSCTICDLVQPLGAEGRPCPRCGARLSARKPDAQVRTLALVIASFVLYAPANIYPMTTTVSFGGTDAYTIFRGIEELVQAHLWPLAIVIFTTSISIPLLKLVALAWFLFSIHRPSPRRLVLRTKLHRLVDWIGRWSCIDPFAVAVFAPLMQFGQLATVHGGPGGIAFILVVLLTMLASECFDARLMWDAVAAGTR